jgi:hypothetical protein
MFMQLCLELPGEIEFDKDKDIIIERDEYHYIFNLDYSKKLLLINEDDTD